MIVSRYMKAGIIKYVTEHEYDIIILEDCLQVSSPYTEEDIIHLMDIAKVDKQVIMLLSDNHKSNFMKALYMSRIYETLYTEDTLHKNILNFLMHKSTREQFGEYYGLTCARDIKKRCNLVNM